MATIYINAAQEEELRIAIVDENNKIRDLIFEHPGREEKVHNIYKGIVTGVETSLNAVFVNYGADKHGFLPIKDISPRSLYPLPESQVPAETKEPRSAKSESAADSLKHVEAEMPSVDQPSKVEDTRVEDTRAESSAPTTQPLEVNIEDIKVGQEFIVQVDKEERGTKGAALTNQLSLAGRYLVLMPENPQAGGISRRVEGEDRDALRESLKQLNKPNDVGVIIRTSGVNKTQEELQWDLDMLVELWRAIKEASNKRKAPFLIFQESGIVNRIVRDYLAQDIDQIIVNNSAFYENLKEHIEFIRPKFANKLTLYTDKTPLFSRYNLEKQIDNVYHSSIRLDSGGSIVINRTEALVSIDVNSARATRGSGIEETALQINLEAADEIGRQLRLRDIGGLIVIDFIDMSSNQHQKEVEIRLRSALRTDRARVQIGRISRFGLLEMSRQRLKSSLSEETQTICPRCKGEGHVRSVQSLALSILRVIEEDAVKGQVSKIQLQVPVDMAAFFLNEKRKKLVEIEEQYNVKVVVLPNLNLHSPHYQIKREKAVAEGLVKKTIKSHEAIASYEEVSIPGNERLEGEGKPAPKPAVEFTVSRPAPTPGSEGVPGLLKRLFANVFGSSETTKTKEKAAGARKGGRYTPRHKSGGYQTRRGQGEGADESRRHSGRRSKNYKGKYKGGENRARGRRTENS